MENKVREFKLCVEGCFREFVTINVRSSSNYLYSVMNTGVELKITSTQQNSGIFAKSVGSLNSISKNTPRCPN